MTKQQFQQAAAARGIQASFSGKDGKIYLKGEDKEVKTLIRQVCLKQKGQFPTLGYKVAQAKA
jgi:hypothetical protein